MRIPIDDIDRSAGGEWLGSGSFGRVFSGHWDGRPVAYKLLKHAFHRSIIDREIQILRCLVGHPHIIECLGEIDETNVVGFVMTRADGIPLSACIEYYDMPDPARDRIARDLIETVAFIHAQGVLHRDLKPDNILVDRSRWFAWIIDFGSAICMPPHPTGMVRGIVGTHGFMAPEVADGRAYGLPADIYSLGMTLMSLWTDRAPLRSPDAMALIAWHHRRGWISDAYASILHGSIHPSPRMRPSTNRMRAILDGTAASPRPARSRGCGGWGWRWGWRWGWPPMFRRRGYTTTS